MTAAIDLLLLRKAIQGTGVSSLEYSNTTTILRLERTPPKWGQLSLFKQMEKMSHSP